MNILITLSYYLPNVSGLTNYVKNLSAGLTERGHKVSILTSKHKKALPDGEVIEGIKVNRVWTPLLIGRGPIMPMYFIDAFIHIRKADVVNVHLPQFEGFITAIISKILGKKVVVTYHCDLSFWGGFLNIVSTFLIYASNLICCLLADKIIVNSKEYAESSWFLRLQKKKLTYIYPPVKIGKAKTGVLKKYKKVKYKIGFVGRISKEKGVGRLLEAIKYLKVKLPSFKIFLVGPGDDIIGGSQAGEIGSLLNKYKNNIVLLGKLSDEELFGFYKEIDCLVLPSTERQESFGMVQVEAMLSGCPVVVSDLPWLKIGLSEGKIGKTFTPKNPASLSKAIFEIVTGDKVSLMDIKSVSDLFDCNKSLMAYGEIFRN